MSKEKSNIIVPFKPTLTITIEVNETTGQAQIIPSKPVNPAMMFETLLNTLRGTFRETVMGYENQVKMANLRTKVERTNGQ